jgi:WD40 repeat protein
VSGTTFAYDRRTVHSAPKSPDVVLSSRKSPQARAGAGAAEDACRYIVRNRYVTAYPPTGFQPAEGGAPQGPPDCTPELEHVYGYRSHTPGLNVSNPLIVLPPDIVVYAAARLCVVLDSSNNSQAFYGGHADDVLCVAATTVGGGAGAESAIVLASGELGRRPAIHLWSLEGAEQIAVLPDTQHERGIAMLAFSPDSQWLVSVGLDNAHMLVVWDWRRGLPLVSVKAHNESLYALAFNPAERDTFSVAGVKAYKVFRIEVPPPDRGGPTSLSSSTSAAAAAAASIASAGLAALGAPPLLITKRTGVFGKVGCGVGGQPQTLLCLTYTPDGHAITGCVSGDVLVWQGQEVVTKLRGAHEAPVYAVTVVPGSQLVTGDRHGVLALWDSSFTHVLSRALDDHAREGLELPAVRCLSALGARSAAGTPTAASGGGGGGGGGGGSGGVGGGASSSESPPGSVLIGCSDGSIREIELLTGAAHFWMQAHGQGALSGLATDPTEPGRFVSCANDRTVRVWSAADRWPVASCTLSEEARAVDWSPDGSRLAVGLMNGAVLLLLADTLEPIVSVRRRQVRWR